MPSSYTSNLGIELPADGELDGVWGDVVNDNMGILDRAVNGSVSLTLTGTTSTLTTSDGTLSDGQYKLLVLAGSPSGTHTITIAPNDAQKIYFVRNTTAQSVVFTQGSGGNVTIATGDSGIIYATGAGAASAVVNVTDDFAMSSVKITGGSIDGAAIGGSSAAAGSFTTGSFSGDLTIADKIVHSGDPDTAIRFPAADTVTVETSGVERMRVDSSGNLLVGKTAFNDNVVGTELRSTGLFIAVRSAGDVALFNRLASDGTVIAIMQAGIVEGTISVSGTTVSYNGGHLSRWAQFPDNSRPDLLKGTVMSNLDQMANWDNEDNEQLNTVQISDVEGDSNVAGVFVAWDSTEDSYNDIMLAMTGDMIIRIGAGVTVQRGDLLMSAGDGTAMPQGDDIVRSKTIAKVTSTHVSHTYADGSYAVPCVLMAC